MSSRYTLKAVCVDDVRPEVTLTVVLEAFDNGYRIHHIKSDSIAVSARNTFVPLRHISKQKRRIFELEEENAKLRELVRKWYPHMARRVGKDALSQWGQLDVLRELGIEVEDA